VALPALALPPMCHVSFFLLLQCAMCTFCPVCRLLVHMRCYGVQSHPHGESWLCDVCALPDLTQPPACTLCPCVGGAMKVTSEGGWCHLMCAAWVPGCAVADEAR
jgi:hypothetical protein